MFKIGDILKGQSGRRYKLIKMTPGYNSAVGLCISIVTGDLYSKLNTEMNIDLSCCTLEAKQKSNKPAWF